MLSSIHPLGERAKGNAYWITATAHVVGATAGGLALGAIAAVAAVAARFAATTPPSCGQGPSAAPCSPWRPSSIGGCRRGDGK